MKKYKYILITIISIFVSLIFTQTNIKADSVINSTVEEVFGNTINSVTIYSSGKIEFKYKYGLRKAELYYCEEGVDCDNNIYYMKVIVDSTMNNPNKNDQQELAKYEYFFDLNKDKKYKIRVETYFATSSSYVGGESLYGYPIGSMQYVDSGDKYVSGQYSSSTNTYIKDERLRGLLEKITLIVNTTIIPIIYALTSMFLIIKGGMLGVEIVKSADNINVRQEKIGALKWLVIGVAIAYLSTTLVGLVTGFFQKAFA